MQQIVYVVGKGNPMGNWNLCGIFSDKTTAELICTSSEYFIGPITINQPIYSPEWKGTYFPIETVANNNLVKKDKNE